MPSKVDIVTGDDVFRAQVRSGDWPQDTCEACQRTKRCCRSYSHHHGDCCTHCGNDERNPRTWGWRGKKMGKDGWVD